MPPSGMTGSPSATTSTTMSTRAGWPRTRCPRVPDVGRVPRARPQQQGPDPPAARTSRGRGAGRRSRHAASRATSTRPAWTRPRSRRPAPSRSRPFLDRIDAVALGRRPPGLEPRPPSRRRGRAVRDRRRVRLRGRRASTSRISARRASGCPSGATTSTTTSDRSGCATAYTAHVAAQLRNLGAEEAAAAASADAILAFERRLAEASLSPEQRRDPKLTLNRFDVAALDDVMPRLPARRVPPRRRRDAATRSASTARRSSRPSTGVLADTPVDTLRDVLRWHLVRSSASSLAPAFDEENFAFYGRILGGQQAQQPRWKRVVGAASADVGEARRAAVRARDVPARGEGPRARRWSSTCCPPWAGRSAATPWMTDATREEALRKLAAFGVQDRVPRRWRDYSALDVDRDSYVRRNRLAASRVRARPPAVEARHAGRRARVADARRTS